MGKAFVILDKSGRQGQGSVSPNGLPDAAEGKKMRGEAVLALGAGQFCRPASVARMGYRGGVDAGTTPQPMHKGLLALGVGLG